MVQDYDAKGSVDDEDDDDELLESAIDDTGLSLDLENPEEEYPLGVDADNHIHVDVGGDGLEDDRAKDTKIDENAETTGASTEERVPQPIRGRMTNYRAHFQSEAMLAEFREVYRIPADMTLQLVPLGTKAKPGPKEAVMPMAGVCIRGVQFPFPWFVRRFFNTLHITTSQLSLNAYQIIFRVAELNADMSSTSGWRV